MSLGLSKKKRVLKYIIIIAICFTVSGFGISYLTKFELEDFQYLASEEEKNQFSILAAQYEQELWGTANRSVADELASTLVESPEGYYYQNVDYEDDDRASWKTYQHLQKLRTLIQNYGKEVLEADENVRAIVLGTLDYWLDHDFQCPNWWYNDIGTPTMLVDIGIMLKPYLSEEQNNKIKSIVERGVISSFNGTKKRTGANLMDAVDITIKYAFLTNRAYFLKKAVAYAEKEIFISEGDTEGIKTDYTFYQHGAQQACMSYGIVYVSNLAKFICWLNGTLFQFSAEKLGILVDFILEGQRYACRGNRSNYLTNGRSYSRRDGNIASSLKSTIGRLLSLEGMPRKSELQQFYYSFDDLSYAVNDTKYYPYAHSLFTISPDYYMAVKGAYQGFRNSELVNSENILARNMGYGGLTTYQYTGYEYDNIGAIWDFSMLPGTTAFNETDAMLVAYQGNSTGYYYGSMTTHSGGASVKSGNTTETITCSTAGGLYVDIVNEEGLYSRQAYICYQGLMIGLGNSLTCSNLSNSRQIFTTINQVYAVNATYHYTAINGTQSITDTSVVYNDAFAYYNLGGGDLKAVVRNTTGDLKRNNLATSGTYSADVFTLYYIQGICPQNQSFAYAVLANPHSTAPNDASGLPIMKITNTNIFQAVEFTDGTTVAIFHQAGTFTTMNGKIISAANACVEIDFF